MAAARTGSSRLEGFEAYINDVGQGEITVLLHSSGMSGDQWRRTAEHLVRSGARALVPDLLGSGRSEPWPEGKPFSFQDDVALVDRLLKRIELPVHLVGHSYGGLIALRAALLEPGRVLSLALYDPVAFGVLDPARDADAVGDLARVHFGWGETAAEHEAWLRSFVEYWSGEGAWSRLREEVRAEFLRVGWIVHEGARSLVADTTRADAYQMVTFPTLLITGEESPLAAQRVVERLGNAIYGARVERIAGAGHMGPLTHAKQLNELLAAHLAGVDR
jgi:pimeloyl-ACP methyl ester carboxylesterase